MIATLACATGIATWGYLLAKVPARLKHFAGVSLVDVAKIRAKDLAAAPTCCSRDHHLDPWGNDYQVICLPAPGPAIVLSAGEDGRFGTADDLRSDSF